MSKFLFFLIIITKIEKLIGIAKAIIFPNNEPERIESHIIIIIPLIASTIDIKEIKEIFSLRKI